MVDTPDRDLERAQLQHDASVSREVKAMATNFRQADLPEYRSWDKKHCFDCGDKIPKARAAMGRVRCVSCQEDVEKAIARRS